MDANEQKKMLLPYIQRAEEVDKLDRKIAYYCRLYAVTQGAELPNLMDPMRGIVLVLMNKLEKDKQGLELGPDDGPYCETFAVNLFNRANRVDRAGQADASTAKTFYVASIFIDILRQFGELPPDLAEKQRYAAWKVADIRKALREGRSPTPGNPNAADPTLSTDLGLPDGPQGAPDQPPAQNGSHTDPSSSQQSSAAPPGSNPYPPNHARSGPDSSQQQQAHHLRFSVGQKVLYAKAGVEQPARGQVVEVGQLPGSYQVGLAGMLVSASEAELAGDYQPGQVVMVSAPGQPGQEAAVSEADMSRWPPMYTITVKGQAVPGVPETFLRPLQREKSDLMPPQPGVPPVNTPQDLPDEDMPDRPGPGQNSEAGRSASPSPPPTAHGGPTPFSDSAPAPPSVPSASAPAPGYPSISHPGPEQQPSSDRGYGHGPGSSGRGPTPPPQFPGGAGGYPPNPGSFPQHPASGPSAGRGAGPPSGRQPQSHPTGTAMYQPPDSSAGFQPSLSAITESQKQAKYAASSLSFEDVASARKFLTQALKLLCQP